MTDSFQKSVKTRIKLHKTANTMSKNCVREAGVGIRGGEGGRRENGGNSAQRAQLDLNTRSRHRTVASDNSLRLGIE